MSVFGRGWQDWSNQLFRQLNVGRVGRGELPYTADGSLDAMDAGYCHVAVMEESHLTAALSLGPQHCDKGSVGPGVVPTTPIALPLSSRIEPLVSFMIYQYRESGSYQAHYDDPASWPLDCLPELARRAPPALDEVRPPPPPHHPPLGA